jgi:hypothetical protein
MSDQKFRMRNGHYLWARFVISGAGQATWRLETPLARAASRVF